MTSERVSTRNGGAAFVTTDVTYRGNVSDPGDNLTETITTNSTAGGGTLVNSFTYSYDANKNKLKETIGGPLNPYGFGTTVGQEAAYDAEDRLTDWHRDDTLRDLNYALSLVGDWNTFTVEGVTETRTHGNAHELTNLAGGANPGALTHDAKGNILTSPAHGSQTYVWDFDNQLMSATSGGTHDYYYDALGRRVMKHVSGEKKLIFVHDGQRIIAEYKYTNGVIGIPGGIGTGTSATSQSSQTQSNAAVVIGTRRGTATLLRKYVYATYVDERCLFIDKTALGSIGAGTEELFYYHANNLYSVAAMTDAAGLITERYAYDAYGNIIFLSAAGAPLGTQASTIGQPYTYTGRRFDEETGLYQYRARYYDAALGRFIGRDPIEYDGGLNLYGYVGSNPINRVDPMGLNPFSPFGHPITWPSQVDDALQPRLKNRLKSGIRKYAETHSEYAYYTPSGLKAFFDNLLSTVDNQVGRVDVSDSMTWVVGAVGTYSPSSNELNLASARGFDDGLTLVHEMVHAMDDENDWYFNTALTWDYEKAEALAYGAEHLLSSASGMLQTFEDRLRNWDHRNCREVQSDWNAAIMQFSYLKNTRVSWGRLQRSRFLMDKDLGDVRVKLGIHFSCKELLPIYQGLVREHFSCVRGKRCFLKCPDGLPSNLQ